MAIFHLSLKVFSRSKGQSAVAAASYRAGVRLWDVRAGTTADYTRKQGVVTSFLSFPATMPLGLRDRGVLWNLAEAAENRKNSRVAREIDVALPYELNPAAREDLVRQLAQELVNRYGVAVDSSIHLPDRGGDLRNHHAHILFTTRAVGAEGFGEKTLALDSFAQGSIETLALRIAWETMVNQALEIAGLSARIDHRSHKDKGMDVPPQIHVGVNSTNMSRLGKEIRGSVIKVDFRGREVDYTQIDQGRSRAEYNAEIIELQKHRPPETLPEELGRITAKVNDLSATVEQLQSALNPVFLSEEIMVKIRIRIEKVLQKLFENYKSAWLKAYRQNRKIELALKAKSKEYAAVLKYQAELDQRYRQEQAKIEADRKLMEAMTMMCVRLNGVPPYIVKLDIPLRAQFNEVAYRQNLKTLSSSAIELILFRPPDKPPPRALATLTLRHDVLAIKELLSRANLPQKGRGRITARQEFARKRR